MKTEDQHSRVENSGVIDVNGRDFAMLVLCKCINLKYTITQL